MRNRSFLAGLLAVLILIAAVAPASAFSFGKGKKGSGDMETRDFDLDRFEAVEIGGAFDLDITIGDRQTVQITIDDNLWDLLEVKVRGNTLELDWEENCRPDGDCRAVITVPELTEVVIQGAGDVDIENYHGSEFSFVCHGAGDLNMEGEVGRLEIRINGAGDVDTRDLTAQEAEISINGAGNARIHVEESLRARVSGVGNLTYYGDPDKKDTRVSGIGSIKAR